ncbi:MAG: flagellar basal body rod protein FlgC [Parahaliea sp.]
MSLFSAISVAGSSLDAQSVRLNTIASNLANANNVQGSADQVYRPRYAHFATAMTDASLQQSGSVRVNGIVESTLPALREYDPGHPLADGEGYIYRPNLNPVDEMVNMMSASRSYQNSVQVLETTKQLALRILTLGR